MTDTVPAWLRDAVSVFGAACYQKLRGPGEQEAAIRSPIESLISTIGAHLGVPAVLHDEVRDSVRRVRPDYGVSVKNAITGYIEVKAPGRTVNPANMPPKSHDREQWERQRDLPNLLYTNGTEWRLYRDGELLKLAILSGDLDKNVGATAEFESVLTNFLRWEPVPINSVDALVRSVAPLTRLLRGEVLDQMYAEKRAVESGEDEDGQPFTGLSRDWKNLLFPKATEFEFADGYAQAVTFALLLARHDGIDISKKSLHEIGAELAKGQQHTLMGKALQLLTDDVAADFRVTLSLLVRVVGAVNWQRIRTGRKDVYLYLYEDFLYQYDPDLRKASGSYYTPREVVEHMVRLAEEALVTKLGRKAGFRDPDVLTVDPAMGTGTYLHTIIERVAASAEASDGPGARKGAVERVAERLVGFELQMGPYAVAELRIRELMAEFDGAQPPPSGLKLYVTDTLDDPHTAYTQIAAGLQTLAQSRRRANEIKRKANVTVVIGNPPYRELAIGYGGWVESGGEDSRDTSGKKRTRAILDDFLEGVKGVFNTVVPGRFSAKLKNLYIYFWRWATWKVWESTKDEIDGGAGIVCYISTSGYLTGPAFTAMREYLRRYASEGWIINVTPEGQTPHIPTRIFPTVRQPLAIALFVRKPDTSTDTPAVIHYRSVHGSKEDKFTALSNIRLDDDGWRDVRTKWTAPLTPVTEGSSWDDYVALANIFPWYSPGVFPTRTWVYAPDAESLVARWHALVGEQSARTQKDLFKEGRDAGPDKNKLPLPGRDTMHQDGNTPVRGDRTTEPKPVRMGYRAFDRQWVLPDSRLMDMPRANLWAARIPAQVFVIEQHSHPISDGPGILFSGLIPDYDYFKGSEGGRALPFLHPDGTPNVARGLAGVLTQILGATVTEHDVLAYVAAVVAHPGFTQKFAPDLTTPGIRVPISRDRDLWQRAVKLGNRVVWLHTYGAAFVGDGRPANNIRLPDGDPRRPLAMRAISGLPDKVDYDEKRGVIVTDNFGEFGPVPPEVWAYAVGGKNVIHSWFNYRKASPGGRRTSRLSDIHAQAWPSEWTTELVDLLAVLTQLVELEPAQAELLAQILDGQVLGTDELSEAGVRWPVSNEDRKPRFDLRTVEANTSEALAQPSLETLDGRSVGEVI